MAEQIVNEFTVNRPIDEAWPIICDVERIAPCLPGAQLEEIEGDVYRGRVKVKLGAVTAQFKGEAQFVERDDTAHTAKLKGKGRDTGGRGNAEADIYAAAEALSPTSTKCTVTADLHITGKVAQFGRGIMGDVSKKLMDQFAEQPEHHARRAGERTGRVGIHCRPVHRRHTHRCGARGRRSHGYGDRPQGQRAGRRAGRSGGHGRPGPAQAPCPSSRGGAPAPAAPPPPPVSTLRRGSRPGA